jgi:hypothetical protein
MPKRETENNRFGNMSQKKGTWVETEEDLWEDTNR